VGEVDYTNTGTGTTREITIDLGTEGTTFGIKTVAYTQIAGTGLGACKSETGTTAKLTGEVLVTGETDVATGAVHTGIWVE
jgi:hypothetical protein